MVEAAAEEARLAWENGEVDKDSYQLTAVDTFQMTNTVFIK